MRLTAITVILAFLLSVCSCGGGSGMDVEWDEIDRLCDSVPEEAVGILDTIDRTGLSEKDLNRHRLLWIKSRDKAFIAHTSDTLILDVVDYYARHRSEGLYPEALYYGGRVYSDIGDAPTALRYFQDALDALPDGQDDNLASRIYNQMGSLLNSLRLYKEASEFLKKSIKIKKADGDSLNLMRDIQLMGAVYMHSEDYSRADSCFREACQIARDISHKDTMSMDIYLAATDLYRGNISEALVRIRGILKNPPERKRDLFYSYASQVYYEAGIYDTAYLLASKMIRSKNNDYRRIGYSIILSPALRIFSSLDSLLLYTLAYRESVDEYLDRHDAQQVTLQTSLYNYQTHERARKDAEDSKRRFKRRFMYVTCMALLLVMALCVGLLYLRNRKMKIQLDYRKSLDNIKQLQSILSSTEEKLRNSERVVERLEEEKTDTEKKLSGPEEEYGFTAETDKVDPAVGNDVEEDRVREQLKERLLRLQKTGEAKKNDPRETLTVSVYDRLRKNIENKNGLKVDDEIWMEIENAVLEASSDFKSNLALLIGGRMKSDVYHMALLIRCGFGPTETGILLGRTKGAVSSRRGYICEKIFGEKYGGKVMDDIINLL